MISSERSLEMGSEYFYSKPLNMSRFPLKAERGFLSVIPQVRSNVETRNLVENVLDERQGVLHIKQSVEFTGVQTQTQFGVPTRVHKRSQVKWSGKLRPISDCDGAVIS